MFRELLFDLTAEIHLKIVFFLFFNQEGRFLSVNDMSANMSNICIFLAVRTHFCV